MAKWKPWLFAILWYAINGFVNAVILTAVVPEASFWSVAKASGLMALLAVAGFLKRSPLPKEIWTEEERRRYLESNGKITRT